LHDAILIGGGQFCTKPGHVFVPEGSEGDHFLEVLRAEFRKAVSPILLSTQLSSRYERGCAALEATPGVSVLARGQSAGQGAASVQPTLFLVSADTFLRETLLHEEVFGPMSLIIRAPAGRLPEIAAQYQGELTATVHGAVHEHQSIAELSERLRTRVGRVLFQGFSPGVELCDGVNHGGPWPSALGRSTVVGTTSYERWLRPVCFQDAPYDLLPPELRPDNPLNLSRRVDDEYQVPNSEA
jgi:NADP-dependent aldehyde dehydrogenase